MDYSKIYNDFIASRKGLALGGYTEKHHILPRSMGGSDCSSNIIKLKAREHFFGHLLLAKIYGGKMWAALSFMSRSGTKSAKNYRCNSRQYQLAKTKDAEWKSKIYSGDSNPFYGKTHDQETIARMRKPRVNKKICTEESVRVLAI